MAADEAGVVHERAPLYPDSLAELLVAKAAPRLREAQAVREGGTL